MGTLLQSMRSTFAVEFFQSLTDPKSDDDYYMFYGRVKPWETDSTPSAVDSIKEQNEAKRNIVFYQKIIPSDVSLVAPRYNWSSGIVYDQYEDDVQLWKLNKKYYVLTQEGDTYAVFICLSNNNGTPSTVVPTIPTTGGAATQEIITSDGYVWKYLYTLTDEMEKFLTTTYLPVLILDKISYSDVRALALSVKADSVNGSIQKITVDTADTFTTLVNPNLNSSSTNYRVTSFNSTTLVLTTPVGSQMSSVSGFYNNNYIIFFENGKLGTVDSYVVNNGVATITLCELYPNDGTTINSGQQFSILPKISIRGNGTGAIAIPKFTNNILTTVDVVNGGEDYNFAEVFFLVDTVASLSAVIPPIGGHGFDLLGELKPTNILISKDLSFAVIPDDQEKYFGSGAFIRQIGIVKNIKTNQNQIPSPPTNTHDMVLKYDGFVNGTQYFKNNDPFTSPYFRTKTVLDTPDAGQDVNGFNNFFIVGNTYTGADSSVPPKQWKGKLISKEKVPLRATNPNLFLIFAQESLSGNLMASNFPLADSNGNSYLFSGYTSYIRSTDVPLNLNYNDFDYYLNFSNFDNSTGKVYSSSSISTIINSNIVTTSNPNITVNYPNFFSLNDIISVQRDSEMIFRLKVEEIIQPGMESSTSFISNALPTGVKSTTIRCSYVQGDVAALNSVASINAFGLNTDTTFNKIINQTKTLDEINNPDGDLIQWNLPALGGTGAIFFGGSNSILLKDKLQNPLIEFDSSTLVFSSPATATANSPTHILGNNTLSTAVIESFVVNPEDNLKFNLKITSPSDDYQPATLVNNNVSTGETVSLLKINPSGIFSKISITNDTPNLYVLSENYDVSAPNNIPETITASVISKIELRKDGLFPSSLVPNGSYLYREPTETKDAAIGYVILQDTSSVLVGGTTRSRNLYVQMEKGTFENGDVIISVLDPYVRNVTLYNNNVAGNAGISTVTVFGNEQRYGGLFLNKYSGEVLYIQNIDQTQLTTDTNFTTNILLGF